MANENNSDPQNYIVILPFGEVPEEEIEFLKKTIADKFNLDTVVLRNMPLPLAYYDAQRRQYDSGSFLNLLFDYLPDEAFAIIGVLNEDMFAVGRTFVFGYAHLRDRVAVYSTARLREEWHGRQKNLDLQQSRSYRAIVHELGHVFGNGHCDDEKCVMHSVAQIDSLDKLAIDYCQACQTRVRYSKVISALSAEGRFQRGSAYQRRQQYERACHAFRDALALSPDDARCMNDLGVALLSAGKRQAAREAFQLAADLSEYFPHPYYNLGILCQKDGGAEAAEFYFDLALSRASDQLDAHRYIGTLYEEFFNDPARALEHYRAYTDLGGQEQEILERIDRIIAVLALR